MNSGAESRRVLGIVRASREGQADSSLRNVSISFPEASIKFPGLNAKFPEGSVNFPELSLKFSELSLKFLELSINVRKVSTNFPYVSIISGERMLACQAWASAAQKSGRVRGCFSTKSNEV